MLQDADVGHGEGWENQPIFRDGGTPEGFFGGDHLDHRVRQLDDLVRIGGDVEYENVLARRRGEVNLAAEHGALAKLSAR